MRAVTVKTEQLALVEIAAAPKLTDRQAAVLQAVQAAGLDGLHADEAGAVAHALKEGRWRHGRDERCAFCGSDGNAILRRLRTLGLVKYRLRTGWVAVGAAKPDPPGMTNEIPF